MISLIVFGCWWLAAQAGAGAETPPAASAASAPSDRSLDADAAMAWALEKLGRAIAGIEAEKRPTLARPERPFECGGGGAQRLEWLSLSATSEGELVRLDWNGGAPRADRLAFSMSNGTRITSLESGGDAARSTFLRIAAAVQVSDRWPKFNGGWFGGPSHAPTASLMLFGDGLGGGRPRTLFRGSARVAESPTTDHSILSSVLFVSSNELRNLALRETAAPAAARELSAFARTVALEGMRAAIERRDAGDGDANLPPAQRLRFYCNILSDVGTAEDLALLRGTDDGAASDARLGTLCAFALRLESAAVRETTAAAGMTSAVYDVRQQTRRRLREWTPAGARALLEPLLAASIYNEEAAADVVAAFLDTFGDASPEADAASLAAVRTAAASNHNISNISINSNIAAALKTVAGRFWERDATRARARTITSRL